MALTAPWCLPGHCTEDAAPFSRDAWALSATLDAGTYEVSQASLVLVGAAGTWDASNHWQVSLQARDAAGAVVRTLATATWLTAGTGVLRLPVPAAARTVDAGATPLLTVAVTKVGQPGVQRCIAHRLRNVLDKCPKAHHEAAKRGLRAILCAADEAAARAMAARFAERWERAFASMTRWLTSAPDSCLTFYRFPTEHWGRIRTSNLLERCFKEGRRRTAVVGRLPTEESALTLVWAVTVGDTAKWRGVKMAGPSPRLIELATARLMERFYQTWHGDAASALREAQSALLQQAETRRPYHWAAFQVVNGPW